MNELKPCPFCGEMPETDGRLVQCYLMPCDARNFKMPLDSWNTRPIEDALIQRIAELEAAQRWHVVKECNDVATPIDVALRKRIAELEAAQRWIPVSERLPQIGVRVLFYNNFITNIHKGWFSGDEWTSDIGIFYNGDKLKRITHWMPLPEPPEVDG